MPSKTFKPGEYAYYGKCRITITDPTITVSWMEYNGTEVKKQRTFNARTAGNDLPIYLAEQSTTYWSDTMMDWIKKNCDYTEPSLFSGGIW